jgi:hypothetical protein
MIENVYIMRGDMYLQPISMIACITDERCFLRGREAFTNGHKKDGHGEEG